MNVDLIHIGEINHIYDIRYYNIGLLYLIFDIEIIYIYPIISNINIYTISYIYLFIYILLIGLIYEYINSPTKI
jgi:NADH-quinone oxidoreductase subunit A